MKHKKFIGITLLFYQEKKSNYVAFLKSYILKIQNWDDLQMEIKKIISVSKTLKYIGVEDVFYVSGPLKEEEVLGKSYIDDIIKIKDAKKLLLKKSEYTFNFQKSIQKEKWFLFSLIYFYYDKSIGDKLSISCLTPIYAKDIENAKIKIGKFCNTEYFLKKILLFKLDKMHYYNLKYIGIEDVSIIEENVEEKGSFEYSFKKYKRIEQIHDLLPSKEKILKSFKRIINI